MDKTTENLKAIVEKNPQIANSLLQYWQRFSDLQNNPFLRWEYANYHEIVEQYIDLYRRMIEYSDVSMVSYQNDLDDEFFDKLEHTISATQNAGISMTSCASYKPSDDQFYSRLHVGYSQMFNKIAEYWDQHCNADSDDCKHRFVVSISNRTDVVAYSYFNQLPPDNRLIEISLPIGVQYAPHRMFPMVMHEIGHYIGLRDRNKRKDMYHQLVICELLKRLYQEGLYYTFETDEKPLNIYENNRVDELGTETERKKKLCAHMICFLNDRYDAFKKIFLEIYQIHSGLRNDASNKSARLGNESYARELINLTNIALFQGLDDMRVCAQEALRGYCQQYRSLYEHKTSIERLEDDLSLTIDKAFEMLKLRWVNDHPDTQIARRCMTYFTEIAADIFMVRTLNMKRDSYLWLMFERWINCNEAQLANVMRSDTVMMRYPSVSNLLLEQAENQSFVDDHLSESYVAGLYHKVLNEAGQSVTLKDGERETIRANFEFFKQQIAALCDFQKNPVMRDEKVPGYNIQLRQLGIIRDYAEKLYKEADYAQAEKDMGAPEHAVLKHIRDIYRDSLNNKGVATSLKLVLSYVFS